MGALHSRAILESVWSFLSLSSASHRIDLRIFQTIAGTRIDHGGTSRSVPALCESLGQIGEETHLIVGVPYNDFPRSILPSEPTKVHCCPEDRFWGRATLGFKFASTLERLYAENSLVHDHGVWLTTNHAVASFCRRRRVKRIVSPRGMVGTWAMAFGGFKKRIAWWSYQRKDMFTADAFHATSEQEAQELRKLGCLQPIAVIPNGLTVPTHLPERPEHDDVRVLFMSRIHPKKGLINLLEAWKLSNMPTNWKLVLAGPDEGGYQRTVLAEVQRLKLEERVEFLGPIDDQDKWQVYRGADLFVLPSFNENFGIVIAEAMYAGLPVITTTGTPWEVLNSKQCGWWVEPTVAGIAQSLRNASLLSRAELLSMGEVGRAYIESKYTWNEVAVQMKEFYQWLANRERPTPSSILL